MSYQRRVYNYLYLELFVLYVTILETGIPCRNAQNFHVRVLQLGFLDACSRSELLLLAVSKDMLVTTISMVTMA
jgi:hypothetical protein